ncbi:MAG: hypothetical protein AMJ79_13460 [Phycisphaerae bacterium SM23_30]|nr:MAG: hypothetical protein AMJ79_13460 [Phycisphaerae bacterium SM23_30]
MKQKIVIFMSLTIIGTSGFYAARAGEQYCRAWHECVNQGCDTYNDCILKSEGAYCWFCEATWQYKFCQQTEEKYPGCQIIPDTNQFCGIKQLGECSGGECEWRDEDEVFCNFTKCVWPEE